MPENPKIARITLPSGTTYDIKDADAQQKIANIMASLTSVLKYIGVTTTPLSDGSTTSTITVAGESHSAEAGDVVIYNDKEFIYSGSQWNEFGDTGSLRALAFKDSASGSYTPAGSVSAPAINVNVAGSTATVNSITDVGTLPVLTTTVSDENLVIGFSQGTLPTKGADTTVKTGDASYSASQPTFTGTQATIEVS